MTIFKQLWSISERANEHEFFTTYIPNGKIVILSIS